jgi:hypothetical protein
MVPETCGNFAFDLQGRAAFTGKSQTDAAPFGVRRAIAGDWPRGGLACSMAEQIIRKRN